LTTQNADNRLSQKWRKGGKMGIFSLLLVPFYFFFAAFPFFFFDLPADTNATSNL